MWREKVNGLLRENKSILFISKFVGSDMETINKFRDNINYQDEKGLAGRPGHALNDLKKELVDLLQSQLKGKNRKQIKIFFGFSKYDKLMKHERVWMEEMLPPRKINLIKKINYKEHDEETYPLIEQVAKQIYLENPPVRITKTMILKRVSSFELARLNGRNKHKFVRINQTLEVYSEKIDDFLIRIFPIVINRFEQSEKYKTLNWGLIIHKLHSGYKGASPKTKEWVIGKIEEYNSCTKRM
ncbi:Tn7-like transposition protein D [Paenibacillus sp. GP183]|nr:Tn7-like transposition protein D [Paenibacillus sp. GP183]